MRRSRSLVAGLLILLLAAALVAVGRMDNGASSGPKAGAADNPAESSAPGEEAQE
ncbi:MAG: hypothetical protein QOJ31_1634, partial [Gaiellales bacterium]|nr:hypothetical protein [Gaiellales bacterium]